MISVFPWNRGQWIIYEYFVCVKAFSEIWNVKFILYEPIFPISPGSFNYVISVFFRRKLYLLEIHFAWDSPDVLFRVFIVHLVWNPWDCIGKNAWFPIFFKSHWNATFYFFRNCYNNFHDNFFAVLRPNENFTWSYSRRSPLLSYSLSSKYVFYNAFSRCISC